MYSAFLHAHPKGMPKGSFGAIAYRIEIENVLYYMAFSWANPYKMTGKGLIKANSIAGYLGI